MSSKRVSVFLVPHGSIDARLEREQFTDPEDPDSGKIYDFSIRCEVLPKNTRLCMPNILGKPYYENRDTMIEFITSKIIDWNDPQQHAAFRDKASSKRPRLPEPKKGSFFRFYRGDAYKV